MKICVIDVGTSSIRSAVTDGHRVICFRQQRTPPDMPEPGLVEFDAMEMTAVILDTATEVINEVGGVDAVAVTNQRGTAMVWDRQTGEPVGPALGWQDLRTVGECLAWQAEGLEMVPNESATKLVYLLDHHDPDRSRDLCFGTVDTWTVWCLSQGASHVVDPSNAAMSGMLADDGLGWSDKIVERLGVPLRCLPQIVDSTGVVGAATALPGAPPIAGIIGDQQSSLIGQRCVLEGLAKLTFGTGAFLDVRTGPDRPIAAKRSDRGTFPIVAWQEDGAIVWGVEAMMIAAGSNMSWLIDDVGLLDDASDSTELAGSVADTGGVVYVPALYGLGTPHWDFGARAALFGITGGTTAAHIVRAVFEGGRPPGRRSAGSGRGRQRLSHRADPSGRRDVPESGVHPDPGRHPRPHGGAVPGAGGHCVGRGGAGRTGAGPVVELAGGGRFLVTEGGRGASSRRRP